jgi:UTP--glucose-1-phosphate uridylyltransferase
MPIKKAVIIAAGFGTRFLPVSRAIPKLLMPVGNKTVLDYLLMELDEAGIRDVLIVTSGKEKMIREYLGTDPSLDRWLKKTGKTHLLDTTKALHKKMRVSIVRQSGAYGSATPVLNAEGWVGKNPFLLLVSDELFVPAKTPRIDAMKTAFQQTRSSIFGIVKTDDAGTHKYGIVEGKKTAQGYLSVEKNFEKPGPEKTSSRWAAIGTYILKPSIFKTIKECGLDERGERSMAPVFKKLIEQENCIAVPLKGQHLDTGNPEDWLKANIAIMNKKTPR